tara:strand:- start:14947 stop:15366 length:420 start_codon:yes stop_codon:yes gene_type:complete
MTNQPSTHRVSPGRLDGGTWSAEFKKHVGEGDIAAAYSADTIGMHGVIRRPFVFRGDLWVNVAQGGGNVKAYRLMPIDDHEARTGFEDRARDCEAARADPKGFYHGIAVRYRSDWFVLTGLPALFVPSEQEQPGLFGDL